MRTIPRCFCLFALAALLVLASAPAFANAGQLSEKIDQIAADALTKSGVPSASIAVVRDGKLAYVHAYGDARLDPKTPPRLPCATASVRSANSSPRRRS